MSHLATKLTTLPIIATLIFFYGTWAMAGSLDSPALPTNTGSAMYTLDDIYNRLDDGTAGSKRMGPFTEPAGDPTEGTSKTLDDVMGKAPAVDNVHGATADEVTKDKTFWGLRSDGWGLKTGALELGAGVPKTGQTKCYLQSGPQTSCASTGQDGDLQRGVAWPDPRWTCYDDSKDVVHCDNLNRIVAMDNLTGLMWTINAYLAETERTWDNAIAYCNNLDRGGYTDWALPNVSQLRSLIDYSQNEWSGSGLPSGHPFTMVQRTYWSRTASHSSDSKAWAVDLFTGDFGTYKFNTYAVWPVRVGK